MKRLFTFIGILIVTFIGLAQLMSCGLGPLAGGSTSETEAAIYGYVRLPSGEPVNKAGVSIRPTGYLKGSTEFNDFKFDTITDNLGYYNFPKIQRGKYVVQIQSGDSLGRVLTTEFSGVTKQLSDTTVVPYGTLILTPPALDSNVYTLNVYGVERDAIQSMPGQIKLALPSGDYGFRISSSNLSNAPREYSNVILESGNKFNIGFSPLPKADSGLIGFWNFEETDSAILDQSPNSLNGKFTGSRVPGKVGRAIQLKDPQAIDLGFPNANPDLYDFKSEQDYTMSAWVRTNRMIPKTGDSQRLISFQKDSGDAFLLRILPDGTAAVSARTMSSDSPAYNQKSHTIVTDGQWHHISGRRQKGWLTIYVDGKPEGSSYADSVFRSGDYLPPFTPNPPPIDINVQNAASGRLFLGGNFVGEQNLEGELDEVKVYNRALSNEEIRSLIAP